MVSRVLYLDSSMLSCPLLSSNDAASCFDYRNGRFLSSSSYRDRDRFRCSDRLRLLSCVFVVFLMSDCGDAVRSLIVKVKRSSNFVF